MHGLGFLLLCQPLLTDRLLAWESRSLVRRSINSYHVSFAGRKSSAIRHLLSAAAGRWTVVCRWRAFGYSRIMSVVSGGKASAIGQLLSGFCRRRSIFCWWLVCMLLSSESYSLVSGSAHSYRASWWPIDRLLW